jgi:pimeloyl-ACP methyl ester carboxylesterase
MNRTRALLLLSLGVLLALGGTGCARWAAGRLATAPNRYPRWLAPGGRTFLLFPDAFLTNFPLQTLAVGPPSAKLRYRIVPPADYQVSVTPSNWFAGGKPRQSFRFAAQLPAATNSFTKHPRGSVFVLHGYGGELAMMLPLALRLAQEGWRCAVPDARGHGASTGRRFSYGVLEAGDLSALLDRLERDGPSGPVAVVGHSFGAALALRWRTLEPRVGSVVALAPYARLGASALNIRSEYSPWFPEWLTAAGFRELPRVLGVGPGELDPATLLPRKPVQALFIVGMDDRITPPSDSHRLKTLAAPGSRVLFVSGADHETVPYYFDPVMPAVVSWLAAETAPPPAPPPGNGSTGAEAAR